MGPQALNFHISLLELFHILGGTTVTAFVMFLETKSHRIKLYNEKWKET